MPGTNWRLCILLFASALSASCGGLFGTGNTLAPDDDVDIAFTVDVAGQTLFGAAPGEACQTDLECRIGLSCVEGKCTTTGDKPEGVPCIVSEDCGDGLVCGFDLENLKNPKMCKPEGEGEEWDVCTTDNDCKKGLYCKVISFSGVCQEEGANDVGGTCESTSDCKAGLYCGVDGVCGILGAQIPPFLGEQCETTAQMGGPPRVLFEVPRGGPLKDFYRLPFPNDIRLMDGKLDLTGHPTPGSGAVGFDVAKRVFQVMGEDLKGFGTNPVVFFRFSHDPALSTINPKDGQDDVFFIDVTDPDDDTTYGKKISFSWEASTGKGLYICRNYLAVHVPWARPLAGDRTYAVILTNGIKAAPEEEGGKNQELTRADDFTAMIQDAAPSEAVLKKAWDVYKPLRQYLASDQAGLLGLSVANVVGATVFSTYDPTLHMAKLREKAVTLPLPELKDVMVCDGTAKSPCDDGLTGPEHQRGCFPPSSDFVEIQGIVRLATFQEGTKPFIEPEDGGGIEWDADGLPVNKAYEEVCFSLTIPKGTPPAAGWPVVLYGHGTGGNYRSHVAEGVAKKLALAQVWNGDDDAPAFDTPVPMAAFGWDQVMHGPRIGPNPLDPDSLVFNFRNPRASLGNFLQSGAEAVVLVRRLVNWNADLPDTPGADTHIDPNNVLFLGHSQGGITGGLALPYLTEVTFAVLSGTGGGLVESLLRKSSPVDVKDGVVVALQDENVKRTHPVLAMLQNYFDSVDPINFAEQMFYAPVDGHKVKVFHPLGLEDKHTPPNTMKALSAAMRAVLAKSKSLPEDQFEEFSGVQKVKLPYKVTTGLTVEYAPVDGEGHFVIFSNVDAILHYTNFLGTAVKYGTPYVPD